MGKLSVARCGRHHPDFSNHRFCPAPEHGFLPAESWMPSSNMGISRRMLEIQGNNSHCHDPTEGTCLWVPIAAVFHNPCILPAILVILRKVQKFDLRDTSARLPEADLVMASDVLYDAGGREG